MLSVVPAIGVAHLTLVGVGCILFSILIGLWCPLWDEPYPRVSQFAYPSTVEKRWFLMHVNRTALRREWYVSSISQFVGARGTTGAKLMILLTTSLSLSTLYLTALLWSTSVIPTASLVLFVLASVGLCTLGFVESAVEWAPLPIDYPQLQCAEDTELMEGYYKQLEVVRLTHAEDSRIKAQFATLHMIAAFLFIGGQFAAQVVDNSSIIALVAASVGLFTFVCFCLLQWLSGCNDALIQSWPKVSRFAVSNLHPKMRFLYWPQDGSLPHDTLKRISYTFISVELCAFSMLASIPGWIALSTSWK